jgi:NADH-quinone oxidoreductase subunit F
MKKLQSYKDLEKIIEDFSNKREKDKNIYITICSGTGCEASGATNLAKAFEEEIKRLKLEDEVKIKRTGCHGFCERGPILVIFPDGIFYQRVKVDDVNKILEETIINKKIVDELLYVDPITGEKIIYEKDVPFYKLQHRIVLKNNALIDPTKIEDYFSIGGYSALIKALKMKPEEIIKEIKESGLRGRGGAGFPTGVKWEICRNNILKLRNSQSAIRNSQSIGYIICNGDEGDPGAYMDRSVLEGNPHSVIEGMIIGAYAIGVNKGYMYIRTEYPLAVKNVSIAIEQAREYGLLGKDILGSKFDFDIEIFRGAGAFVCGEETALIASVEGKRGMPRVRPPYPAQHGLFGQPTNINNVETWANIPIIINKGAKWYSNIGTNTSKGTKIFSLVGKINNTGLVEVPMGMKLKEIIYDIGGGIPKGKKFKAVQTGGPSGGCIPESLLDLPIDYESLTQAGSMMGSGGMIVMDEDTCMVDVAHYFLNFTQSESCGKCVPCRIGTRLMYEILTKIKQGKGEMEDIDRLYEIAETVKSCSLCGLGQTAPNPVLTTIKYFRDEYEAHVKEKRCPALVCKDLIYFYISPEKCIGCTLCAKSCPVSAISGEVKKVHVIDQSKCIKCGTCFEVCPERVSAVIKDSPVEKLKIKNYE